MAMKREMKGSLPVEEPSKFQVLRASTLSGLDMSVYQAYQQKVFHMKIAYRTMVFERTPFEPSIQMYSAITLPF
jgi:hypothetical protein